ncbi:DUF4189 domain-containing protein [Kitasatospora kifunensis]|uniref:DUF4189 domain-containing protein n=1 Tax=Kitasatospora kifunensis TaxID=58351 RepID=A0A7W7R9T7_KITKI|nr:DUF4189 domain-containing protein [Kitasatospora kifunensis]MBB4927890.1 hypothetical protein [Kitasatospora kifunensis]
MAADLSAAGRRRSRLQAEVQLLAQRYREVNFDQQDASWVHIGRFPVPGGWNRPQVEILIDVPHGNPGYPSVAPQWFWTDRADQQRPHRVGGVVGTIALVALASAAVVSSQHSDSQQAAPTPTLTAPAVGPVSDTPGFDPPTVPPLEAPNIDPPTLPAPPPPPPLPPPPPPPPPPPKPDHYGAIAVSRDDSTGRVWDYPSANAADQGALAECPRSDCKVLVTFANSCGAIAYNPATRAYWGGQGATQAKAEESAIDHAGGGNWLAWVCST